MDDELEQLRARALALEVLGERRRAVGRLDRPQREVHLLRRDAARGWADGIDQAALEARLEPAPEREQRGLPLPFVGHAGRGRDSAARSRGRARAGGPRRPADRRGSARRGCADRADRGSARRGAHPTVGRAGQGGSARFGATRWRSLGIAPKLVGVRAVVHVAAALALAGLAFAFGRWLRDPAPGGSLLILLGAAALWIAAARRLYAPGGLGRARVAGPPPPPPEPPDERIDLNAAEASELERLPGIGPVGARRIVEEREAGGAYRSVGDLVRVAGFGPSRVRGLGGPGEGLTNCGWVRVGFRPPRQVVFRRFRGPRCEADRRNVSTAQRTSVSAGDTRSRPTKHDLNLSPTRRR